MLNAKMDEATYLKQVHEQYENLPYPPRDPAKELQVLTFAIIADWTVSITIILVVQLYGLPARIATS